MIIEEINPVKTYLVQIYQTILYLCAIIQRFMKYRYICTTIWMVILGSATDNGNISDSILGVII